MEIKICGITKREETDYLNAAGVDYAGFVVFFEKSKRYVTVSQARSIFPALAPSIKKVAVTVSPTVEQIREIEAAGFDILQVHKKLTPEVLEQSALPVWYACNISDETELSKAIGFLEELPKHLSAKITALVVDGAEYGSGKPFNWRKSKRLKKAGAQSPPSVLSDRKFVLAGGLNPKNVAEGIGIFQPDIVDVSSGVEGESGKDETLVKEFVKNVRGGEHA